MLSFLSQVKGTLGKRSEEVDERVEEGRNNVRRHWEIAEKLLRLYRKIAKLIRKEPTFAPLADKFKSTAI